MTPEWAALATPLGLLALLGLMGWLEALVTRDTFTHEVRRHLEGPAPVDDVEAEVARLLERVQISRQ